MKIANIELNNGLVLAPMAGVTDLPFRILCKEQGADLVVSEMISAKGMYYNDKKTELLTSTNDLERPVALQIFGSDPEIMSEVVKRHLNPRNDFEIIDINMGCPAPKIVKNGDGSALMQTPELARKVIGRVVKASNKPVTVKFRLGWDRESINVVEFAKICEDAGASAITVHARTRDMLYTGKADWLYIAKVKQNVSIPVIGNGDVFSAENAVRLKEETNCDGICLGRGVMGNPWLFAEIKSSLNHKDYTSPHPKEKIEMAIRHLNMTIEHKGERIGLNEMRKQLAWYLKGMRGSNEVRNQINTITDSKKAEDILFNFMKTLNQ